MLIVLLIRHLNGIFLKVILNIFSLGGTWIRGRPSLTELLMSPVIRGGKVWPQIKWRVKCLYWGSVLWLRIGQASLNRENLQLSTIIKVVKCRDGDQNWVLWYTFHSTQFIQGWAQGVMSGEQNVMGWILTTSWVCPLTSVWRNRKHCPRESDV